MIVHNCSRCKENKLFKEVSKYMNIREEPKSEYTLAYCESCGYPALFISKHWNQTSGSYNDDFDRVYPSGERQIEYALPITIKYSYDEAVRCEQHKIWTACIMMAANTLEVICNKHAPETTTVSTALEVMLKKGMLSEELFLWSRKLRALKNLGSNSVSVNVSQHDAREILDFLHAIIELIYYIRPKFTSA